MLPLVIVDRRHLGPELLDVTFTTVPATATGSSVFGTKGAT
jgi:hypothetical protein